MNTIYPGCLAQIIPPAHPLAVGYKVTVLRRAAGNRDLDGADYAPRQCGSKALVWVVRGARVPWGGTYANVFAIGEECLLLGLEAELVTSSAQARRAPELMN